MRGVWVQVTARQHSSLCRGCPSPRVWPEQERWWEPVPSPAGAPRAAGGEDGRLLSEEGGGQAWHLWRGSLMTLILLAQLRVSQGFAPDGVGWVVKGLKHGVTPSTGSLSSEAQA